MKLITSREFNRDVSQAKREARIEPVLITDRGQPTHVLMSIADFRRLSGESERIRSAQEVLVLLGARRPS